MNQESFSVGRDLVVNWHVTEACNYRCQYCYAHWERHDSAEVIRDQLATQKLLLSLYEGIRGDLQPARLRLNFAGGEPLLFTKQVVDAMRFAAGLGFDLSLITNGSRLDPRVVSEIAPLIKVFGISADATTDRSNADIGRADSLGRATSVRFLSEMIDLARGINSHLTIKLNTVVNAVNWDQDLSSLFTQLKPDQWKVLQMLPSTTRNLEVSRKQFDVFLWRHQRFSSFIRVEDNDAMVESYLMIDPHGRFFQNGRQTFGYAYSAPILEVGAKKAAQSIAWSPLKFAARYRTRSEGVVQ